VSGIIDSLLPAIDSILGVRDSAGAAISPVYLVTRTWSGSEVGEGTATDVDTRMLPTPGLKNFSQNINLREGGAVKSGDIILKSVSKNSYTLADLDGSSPSGNVEKFYLVGTKLYQVINVLESYVTWDVQLRELSNQTRY
jgi:hypothetical protein